MALPALDGCVKLRRPAKGVPMLYRSMLAVLIVSSLPYCAAARADDLIDEMMSNASMGGTIKTLGIIACTWQVTGDNLEHDKAELRRNFWAFKSDVNLSDKELADQTKRFNDRWDSLIQVTAKYSVKEVLFLGFDEVGQTKSLDMYYIAYTPRGPLLLTYSMEFKVGDAARVFDFQTMTDWDKIKQTTRNIEHKTNRTRVPTITYDADKLKLVPPKTPESKS